jgi:hypothetical protein
MYFKNTSTCLLLLVVRKWKKGEMSDHADDTSDIFFKNNNMNTRKYIDESIIIALQQTNTPSVPNYKSL